jgi:phosphonate degradation associated HDIG domain protein
MRARGMQFIEQVEALFHRHGGSAYEGSRRESVTALEHALQCAELAEAAQADTMLIAAALLHDVGHFIVRDPQADGIDDMHELRAVPWLERAFGDAVIEPVRLHVQAKRCLVALDPAYAASLSPASVHSLRLQGGPMSPLELQQFEALPFAAEALALRRWDDRAKLPGKPTPPLPHYLTMIDAARGDAKLRTRTP